MYEMLTGLPPFYTSDRKILFERITKTALSFPNYLSTEVRSLLDGLFIKNPEARLGSKGTYEIKGHPWFSNVNWESLLLKEMTPPFIPILKTDTDVSNFAPVKTDL